MIGLELARDPPRHLIAALGPGRRHRNHCGTFKPRRAALETQRAVEIDRQCALARLDCKVQARAAAARCLARCHAIGIARPLQRETAAAAERARQRAHVAGKGDIGKLQGLAARRIVQGGAAGEVQPIDRERGRIEGAVRGGPVDPSVAIKTKIEGHAGDGKLVGAPFAAQQVAQRELDVEPVGAHLAEIVDAADHHGSQPQGRRRQDARIEPARNPHRGADHLGGLGLELRPKLIPIDEIRPDQRSKQSNDEGNRQSEQRRLHGVSLWPKLPARRQYARAGESNIGPSMAKSQRRRESAESLTSHQLAGSRFNPRSTKVGRHSGFCASSSRRPGMRRSNVAMAISASMRASCAPRQK